MSNLNIALENETIRNNEISSDSILNAVSAIVIVLDIEDSIILINSAAEHFLHGSENFLKGRPLNSLLPKDNPIFLLIKKVREKGFPISENKVIIESPRIGENLVNLQVIPLLENPNIIILTLQKISIVEAIDRQLIHRGAARSVTAIASMLAHEVKNPLSGIRGAAQLLEQNIQSEDISLTKLIREETDRICELLDRMEEFSDPGPIQRKAVNIHKVLDRVLQLSKNGFGHQLRYVTNFDPSLPFVLGNHDQLVQVFLNLIKNSAEATTNKVGKITIETAYKHGVSFTIPGTNSQMHLPLKITIKDNGEGIVDDVKNCLFDPFVTSKPQGSGLGLALVAKIVGDHGGVIEFDSSSKGTEFRIMLPMVENSKLLHQKVQEA